MTHLLIACLILSGSPTFPVMSRAPSGSHLTLVHSGEQAVVLELTVDDFLIETVEQEGQRYQRLTIPDLVPTTTPGEPEVPTRGALLGLPSLQGVSVQVLDARYELRRGYHLPSVPQLRLAADTLDDRAEWRIAKARKAEIKGKSGKGEKSFLPFSPSPLLPFPPSPFLPFTLSPLHSFSPSPFLPFSLSSLLPFSLFPPSDRAFYPSQPVEIGYTGYLRDQAVAQVQFYPVQYNPVTTEVRLYRRLLVQITWDPPGQEKSAIRHPPSAIRRWSSPDYERVLRNTILNYAALNRSPISPSTIRNSQFAIRNPPSETAPALKIGVTEEGLYQLTFNDLRSAGFDLSQVDPRTIKLINRGVEIPISVQGESDGRFHAADSILFYGTAINDIYTNQNIYWLTADERPGLRLSTRDGTPAGSAPAPIHFPVTVHAEVNDYYWQTMPNGEGQDHYFWGEPLIAPESREYTVSLNQISTTASAATVRVRLKGRSQDPSVDPDHHTRLSLGGIVIDDGRWDGQSNYGHEVVIPHSSLREGRNQIQVETLGDTAASVDQVLVNWIEVNYWRTYVAENDELNFRAPEAGWFQFEIGGFRRPDVQVFDVTDPTNVVLITQATVVRDGRGYSVRFQDAAQAETRYLALTPAAHRRPISLQLDQPSSWKSPHQGADYIIITPEAFYPNSLRLANHRSASGLRVATVKVEDIYDEFNAGIFHPQAIRDFLSYAYHNWVAPAPTYVVLIGDATLDYKDNLRTGTVNYMPSQIVQTEVLGETPSDNWFVLVSGDDILPDMFIGRLSAQTSSEVDDIVDKIIRYEQDPMANGEWRGGEKGRKGEGEKGEWPVANGEWRGGEKGGKGEGEKGEWPVANGEWRGGEKGRRGEGEKGEWPVANGEWRNPNLNPQSAIRNPQSENVLLVADDDSLLFEALAESLADVLPSGYVADKIYVRRYPPGNPTTDIIEAISSGRLLVQYAGHGNANRWGLWDGNRRFIFNQSDLASLNNIEKWPVVAVANCVNGYFTGPKTLVCIAEAFLRLPDRGAVAVWAPAHFDYPTGHSLLMQAFYQAIFQHGQRHLGAATTAAKIATFAYSSRWHELVEAFVLFGDPATRMR